MQAKLTAIVAAAAVLFTGIARGEVLDAAANGFTVRHRVTIEAARMDVYRAAVDEIGGWWNEDHTMSGYGRNLYMDTDVPGCFCERLGDGAGLAHLTISFVNPGVILRFSGGLGPLGLMGTAGNMTWEFDDVEDGTAVTLQYAVGGYLPGGLGELAGPVDGVLVDALQRLKSFVETGSPTPAEPQ